MEGGNFRLLQGHDGWIYTKFLERRVSSLRLGG